MRPADRGSALLEAIVALSILGGAGLALVSQVAQSIAALRHARETEARVIEADRFLHAVALWPAVELDRRLGNRPSGPWRLEIQRPTRGEYTVALFDSTGGSLLLATSLYRSDDAPSP